ncbi:GMC family oxidoreductase [Sphingomonas oryzagri]|uniref:GMC family oxidoreductase N-terminal domain-containing protein n=1 Tax=Sphingomonas oryzagri TaxID=3042314 RepID=A0ABT6MX71_9SPHN|nr:GMC family oxidoreductase N-terminal domain-containing protein [Sphingomonas oryzagri]MDH7637644.1 GMC family oxidoreductase N-terminal domain-containing protein [Sphingomonas oryzagri]
MPASKPVTPDEEFDYVIVGAGSSGSALAAALARSSQATIAVIEAGVRRWPKITAIPAALLTTIGHHKYDWRYVSEPDPTRFGRTEAWPRGLGPGGSGLINGMIFVRGAPDDYDQWSQLGADGWAYRDVLPHFRRFESTDIGSEQSRGGLGPQTISALRYVHPMTTTFIEGAVTAGLEFNPDYNGSRQDGVSYVQATQSGGRRHSPYDAYLAPAIKSGRIRLIEGAHVKHVLFEGRTATGVLLEQGGGERTIRARRLVVLSAGSLNTPKLLMLSGIGKAATLKAHGITPLVESPEVGANLMEHAGIWLRAEVDRPTFNQEGRSVRRMVNVVRALMGQGPGTSPTAQAVGFVRTKAGLAAPDVQIHFTAFGREALDPKLPDRRLISVVPSVNHPLSRGEVTLASGDYRDAPLIHPRLFAEQEDVETLKRGLAKCLEILGSEPLASHVVRIENPPPEDPEDLDRHIRESAGPIYHPVGTCRMGSDEQAVLTPALHVRGTQRLAVCDASIMPRHVSGNTHAASMMIGDRAADLFLKNVQ